jgi:transposase-like protein
MPTPNQPHSQRYSVKQFRGEFPDDETCLEWLKDRLYPDGIHCPKCDRVTKHHRVMSRKSYSCQNCGHHVHPTAGTIFHKSSTPLTTWFHAIYLMSQTRCGISAMELMRQTGVTYKTAWRMLNQIRRLLEDDEGPIGGEGATVEMDETYVGGRRPEHRGGKKGRPKLPEDGGHKTPVFGVVERGGRIKASVVPNARTKTLIPLAREYVLPKTMVYTDEWTPYLNLPKVGYYHSRVNHRQKVYVSGDVHTNSIEGFFSLVKNGIRGTYHSVGRRHLQSYLDEFTFRYNHRKDETPMFKLVLSRIESV